MLPSIPDAKDRSLQHMHQPLMSKLLGLPWFRGTEQARRRNPTRKKGIYILNVKLVSSQRRAWHEQACK
jgi:hypothetical protein